MNVLSHLQEIARSVFENEHIVLGRESTAADIAEWDSVSHISLVLAVESEFGMRFGTAEIGSLENVGDFVNLIERKMANAA
ncbi:acyl carrier protein [Bosea sp. MMO-172]|uniref:acyl carrier protein n=1 Tax=Bosea sp. MMO-172 TaxID=3127885 RepID=UPI003016E245